MNAVRVRWPVLVVVVNIFTSKEIFALLPERDREHELEHGDVRVHDVGEGQREVRLLRSGGSEGHRGNDSAVRAQLSMASLPARAEKLR